MKPYYIKFPEDACSLGPEWYGSYEDAVKGFAAWYGVSEEEIQELAEIYPGPDPVKVQEASVEISIMET